MMKKILFIAALALSAQAISAQSYVTNVANPDMVHNAMRAPVARHEVVIPDVNGFHVYKADLHIHTIYSDADVTPELRVREAWYDGLDIIAITDHIEYRRQEGKMVAFL
ncbi:MAG: histidinol-phosphatase, partial [Bacteroidales bacterium]|nr:histidinol-phosphatase [Bacteroidales bacterium]